MELKANNFNALETQAIDLGKTTSKIMLRDVFAERPDSYLNEFTLFLAYFNSIPNFTNEINIDCKKAGKWFAAIYKSEIKDVHFLKRCSAVGKKAEYDDVFYILYDDLIINFDTTCSTVRFLFRNTTTIKIDAIINEIKKFRIKRSTKRKAYLYVLLNTNSGIAMKPLRITKPRLSITDNYNEDFEEIHQTIFKRLSKKNDKGLVLLHGKPGTGKTSYIRYLIAMLKKNVIFLPPNMAAAITNLDLISILTENPNCIFVIEDAENIVVDREKDGHSPVSALLNISDGLLSDCLNIQVICSFNTDISKIDSALMRKGRLIAKYEFKELEVEKAKSLSRKLGFGTDFNKPMALTAIYNQGERDFGQNTIKNSIGFRCIDSN